jgi:predicted membrane protein
VGAAELRDEYRLIAGEMVLDLSRVDVPEGATEIDVSVAFGELTVVAPSKDSVVVAAHVEAGEVHVLGNSDEGLDAEARRVIRRRSGAGRVRLDLRVLGGKIEVRSETS